MNLSDRTSIELDIFLYNLKVNNSVVFEAILSTINKFKLSLIVKYRYLTINKIKLSLTLVKYRYLTIIKKRKFQ